MLFSSQNSLDILTCLLIWNILKSDNSHVLIFFCKYLVNSTISPRTMFVGKISPEVQNSFCICFFREWLVGIIWVFLKRKTQVFSTLNFSVAIFSAFQLCESWSCPLKCQLFEQWIFALYSAPLHLPSHDWCLLAFSLYMRDRWTLLWKTKLKAFQLCGPFTLRSNCSTLLWKRKHHHTQRGGQMSRAVLLPIQQAASWIPPVPEVCCPLLEIPEWIL